MVFGHDRMTQGLLCAAEVFFAIFCVRSGHDGELLWGKNVNWSKAWTGESRRWHKGRLVRREAPLDFVDLEDLGRHERKGEWVEGRVLLHTRRYLSVSLDRAALGAIGAQSGDRLRLRAGATERTVRLFDNWKLLAAALQTRHSEIAEPYDGSPVAQLYEQILRVPSEERDESPLLAQMAALWSPDLVASFPQHWYARDQTILLVEPFVRDGAGGSPRYRLDFSEASLGSVVGVAKA
jgi:hypothetical protein